GRKRTGHTPLEDAMPGPLHAPTVLFVYPFRYRDSLTGKWVRARYLAERHEIAARYAIWEITGQPETWADPSDAHELICWSTLRIVTPGRKRQRQCTARPALIRCRPTR